MGIDQLSELIVMYCAKCDDMNMDELALYNVRSVYCYY